MISIFRKIFLDSRQRIVFTIVVSLLFIGAGFAFLSNEMVQNKNYLLRYYNEQQQYLTKQLANEVMLQMENNASIETIVTTLAENQVNSSNRWCYFGCNNELLQAKDANSLSKLRKSDIRTVKELEDWLTIKNQIVTRYSWEYDNDTFVIGIMSDYNSVLLDSKISKHSTYVLMAVGLMSMVFFAIIIFCVLIINRREKQTKTLSQELCTKSKQLEDMSEELIYGDNYAEEYALTLEREDDVVYQEDIILALLMKSNRKELYPMAVLYVSIIMADKSLGREDRKRIMEPVQRKLPKNQIMAEVNQGEYVFLLYRTKKDESEKFRDDLKDYFTQVLPEYGMKCIIEMERIEEQSDHTFLLELYNALKQRIAKKRDT